MTQPVFSKLISRATVLISTLGIFVFFAGCKDGDQLFKPLDPALSGITFKNTLTPTADFNIIDYLYFYNGGGLAIGDINGDGLPDMFFAGNQVKNKLYLNRGDLKFEDITEKAGVAGNSSWNTGAVMGDVNGDGLLDIYVCAVVGLKNLRGHNELYINNGDNTFTESAAKFGLDFDSYSSSAAFLDYDRDGDLDLYILNHAVHTQSSFAHSKARNVRTYETGDKLLRNDDGKFVDVSEQAGIYGGVNGYGLGVAVSDFNMDGFPDLYVGNDFHEDDYLYMNNGDGTFSEVGKKAFTITSKFSMGNDVADINHDGYFDLFTLDMLAEDDRIVKRSESDEHINILRMRTRDYGYSYQFQRNMMQINQGDGTFKETALLSNIAATDWSWSAIFADFDQDGNQDLFVSNGIPRRPNDLDYIKYVSNERIVNTIGTTKLVDEKALALMPSGKVQNYVFKGSGDYYFENMSKQWLPDETSCSSATAVADLDNDGDLDIVVNNIDASPGIYINQTNRSSNYIKIKLTYKGENHFGIGTRVYCYSEGILQVKELYTVRGFQSSSEPLIHFGVGDKTQIDSLKIVWPDGLVQRLERVKTNQTLVIIPEGEVKEDMTWKRQQSPNVNQLFEWVEPNEIGLDFVHKEDSYTDFDRLKLLPYQQSDRGPATAVGDINNDGLDDMYFGGSKYIPGQFFIQSEAGFVMTVLPEIERDSIREDIDAIIRDLNGDGKADLFIGTGGADFFNKSEPLLDSYYRTSPDGFALSNIEGYYENASCVRPFDFDNDGDLDVFVGNQSVSNDFGKIPRSCMLINQGGKFSPMQVELFDHIGMVTDAVWDDYDKDGMVDLIVVGEWMSPVFLKNNGNSFVQQEQVGITSSLNGLWQSISAFDIDQDGDMDYILGNWGLNSKFKASIASPMRMYYSDFDNNGDSETIIAVERQGKYYPIDGFDLIASQIVSLRKKYTSYHSFAGQTVENIFQEGLKNAAVLEVHELASGYLRNEKGNFTFVPLPGEVQISPIMAQLRYDFDADGIDELLLGGNYFGVQPFHGRYGSFPGVLIENESKVTGGRSAGLRLINQSVRQFNIISFQGSKYLIVTVNDGRAQVYKLKK